MSNESYHLQRYHQNINNYAFTRDNRNYTSNCSHFGPVHRILAKSDFKPSTLTIVLVSYFELLFQIPLVVVVFDQLIGIISYSSFSR